MSQDPSAVVTPLDVVAQVSDSSLLDLQGRKDYQITGNILSFHLYPGASFFFLMPSSPLGFKTFEKITLTNLLTGKSSQTTGETLDSLPHSRFLVLLGLVYYDLFADSFFP
jgi:hypothetical protein